MKIALLVLFLLFGLQSITDAQTVSVSARLNEVYSMLPLDCKNSIGKSDGNKCKCNINGELIHVKALFNDSGKLTHVGLDLFTLEDKLAFPPEVLFFIERTFLEFLLIKDLPEIRKKAAEEKIDLRLNGNPIGEKGFTLINQILTVFSGNYTFNIKHDSLYYFAQFSETSGSLQMKFAANNNTVTGMDKKEYGEHISSSLRNFKSPDDWKTILPDTASLKPYKDRIKVSVGDSYFKSITSCKYYIQHPNGMEPLFSKSYPLESFSNAFLMPFKENKKISLQIEHRIYGNEILKYNLPLADFLIYFAKDFEFFFGIEENSEKEMAGTFILYNRNLNFINLLSVKVDMISFFGENPVVTAKFYTNVPSDNIKNLFAEFETGNKN